MNELIPRNFVYYCFLGATVLVVSGVLLVIGLPL